MARVKLFLVHGMGVHGAGWSASIVDVLRALHDKYKSPRRLGFDDKFEPIEIVYDDVLAGLLQQWSDNAASLGAVADDVVPEVIDTVSGFLADASRQDKVGWTHAADVLIYRLLPLVRQRVKTHVAEQMSSHLLAGDPQWVVLAHSLGTAVAHDTLDMLWTGTLPDGRPSGLDPRGSQCLLVAMAANVSRALQTVPKVYQSTVMPGDAGATVPGEVGRFRGCRNFINVRHVIDPFVYPLMFRPVDWPDRDAVVRGLYRDIELTSIVGPNVHALDLYLSDPDFFLDFFRCTAGRTLISGEAEQQARDDHRAKLKPTPVAIRIKEAFEPILPKVTALWPEFAITWDQFAAVLGTLDNG